jgi:hypothetical protein
MKQKNDFLRVYAIPLTVVAISLFGLVSALLGAGMWDYLSWLSLLVPLIIGARKLLS